MLSLTQMKILLRPLLLGLALPKPEWTKKYKTKKRILQKLEAVESIVKDCQQRSPLKKCSYKEFEPVKKDSRLLKEYFQEKNRRLKPAASLDSKRILKSIKTQNNAKHTKSLKTCLHKNRDRILGELTYNLGIYKYQAEKITKAFGERN